MCVKNLGEERFYLSCNGSLKKKKKERKFEQLLYKIGGQDLEALEVSAPGRWLSGGQGGHPTSDVSTLGCQALWSAEG